MADKTLLSRRVKVDDNTTISTLSLLDQIKLLIAQITHPELEALKGRKLALKKDIAMSATLHQFLQEAIEPLHQPDVDHVIIQLKSKFLPYLEKEINDQDGLGTTYDITVIKQDLDYTLDYVVLLKIAKRRIQ